MSEVRNEVIEERVPFEIAVAFLFGDDIPEWVGSAVSDERCPDECSECEAYLFCYLPEHENSLEDLTPDNAGIVKGANE